MPPRHPGPDCSLTMKISIIAAVAKNGTIGKENDLPWRLAEDLRHFKRTTLGKPIIMGRKTFESIDKKPLPGRRNIIVTRDPDYVAEGCIVVDSLDAALSAAGEVEEVMILGGAQIYHEILPVTDRMYLTRVEAEVEGDAFFPKFDLSDWEEVDRRSHPADEKNDHPCTFLVYDRRRSSAAGSS